MADVQRDTGFMTTIVNILGGPGAGKSTTAAGVYHLLKLHDINCELITEYAKELTWDQSFRKLENQIYVFAKQYHAMWRVGDQVDVLVTDSPLFLSLFYGKEESEHFRNLVLETFNKYENMTYLLDRKKRYNPVGRSQTEQEARQIDQGIRDKLTEYGIPFKTLIGNEQAAEIIYAEVFRKLRGG